MTDFIFEDATARYHDVPTEKAFVLNKIDVFAFTMLINVHTCSDIRACALRKRRFSLERSVLSSFA